MVEWNGGMEWTASLLLPPSLPSPLLSLLRLFFPLPPPSLPLQLFMCGVLLFVCAQVNHKSSQSQAYHKSITVYHKSIYHKSIYQFAYQFVSAQAITTRTLL